MSEPSGGKSPTFGQVSKSIRERMVNILSKEDKQFSQFERDERMDVPLMCRFVFDAHTDGCMVS